MLEAHYTHGKQPTLDLASTADGRRTWHAIGLKVDGKRHARAVAAAHGATPWNF